MTKEGSNKPKLNLDNIVDTLMGMSPEELGDLARGEDGQPVELLTMEEFEEIERRDQEIEAQAAVLKLTEDDRQDIKSIFGDSERVYEMVGELRELALMTDLELGQVARRLDGKNESDIYPLDQVENLRGIINSLLISLISYTEEGKYEN